MAHEHALARIRAIRGRSTDTLRARLRILADKQPPTDMLARDLHRAEIVLIRAELAAREADDLLAAAEAKVFH